MLPDISAYGPTSVCSGFISEAVLACELQYMLLAAVSVVVGGVTPIFLTFFYKADTSRYLLGRIIFPVGSAVLPVSLGWLSVVTHFNAAALLWSILALSVICPTVYCIIKADSWVKRVIMCLSNPAIYFTLFVMALSYDISHMVF